MYVSGVFLLLHFLVHLYVHTMASQRVLGIRTPAQKLFEVYVRQVCRHTSADPHFTITAIEVIIVLANPD